MTGQNNLPNLVIAGVNKAGTTSLFTYLGLHPNICSSSIKETCYFLPLLYGEPLKPKEEYFNNFSHCADIPYIMEATPGYFYGGHNIAQGIFDLLGNIRVVIILREPVSRMFSFYKFQKSRLFIPKKMNFDGYVKKCEQFPVTKYRQQKNNPFMGIQGGYYSNFLPAWGDVFGSNLKVIFFDDLIANPIDCVKSIATWLDLEVSIYDGINLNIENRSINYNNKYFQSIALWMNNTYEMFFRRFPRIKNALRVLYYQINGTSFEETISLETRTYLLSHYSSYNRLLNNQLNIMGYRNLPDWLL